MKRTRAAGIIIENGKIALIRRVKNGKEHYVFPGGGVEDGETVEEAVLREVLEETSLTVKIEKFLYHHIYDNDTDHVFYSCKYVSGIPSLGPGNELEEMKRNPSVLYEPVWVAVEKLSGLLLYPLEIRDFLIEDIKLKFENTPKKVSIKISELRRA